MSGRPPRDEQAPRDHQAKRAPRWMVWCGVALVVVFAIVGSLGAGIRLLARRGMSAAEIAEMERYFDEPFDIPAEWRDPKPWSSELVDAANRAAKARDDLYATNRDVGTTITSALFLSLPFERGELTEADLQLLNDGRVATEDFFDAVEELVAVDDYAFGGVKDTRHGFTPHFSGAESSIFQLASWIAPARARLLAEAGDWKGAFSEASTLLRLAKREGPPTSDWMLWGGRCASTAAAILGELAPLCPDRDALDAALRDLEARDVLDPLSRDEWAAMSSDGLERLRVLARAGAAISIPAIATSRELDELSRDALLEHAAARVAALRAGDPEKPYWEALPERMGDSPFPEHWLLSVSLLRRPVHEATYAGTISTNVATIEDEIALNVVRGRLARLALAQRIAELDPARRPAILDEGLADPFDPAGGNLRWSEELKTHYSVGQGGVDDGAKFKRAYSPGAGFVGDIFFGPPAKP